jgi:hypothetical protein
MQLEDNRNEFFQETLCFIFPEILRINMSVKVMAGDKFIKDTNFGLRPSYMTKLLKTITNTDQRLKGDNFSFPRVRLEGDSLASQFANTTVALIDLADSPFTD